METMTINDASTIIEVKGLIKTAVESDYIGFSYFSKYGEKIDFEFSTNDMAADVRNTNWNFNPDQHVKNELERKENGALYLPDVLTLAKSAVDIKEKLEELSAFFDGVKVVK